MIITKVARIPLKIPMMLAQPANGSLAPCVPVTHKHVEGSSDDDVYVVESKVTRTPANFKSHYELHHFNMVFKKRLKGCMVFNFNLVERALSSVLHIFFH